MRSAVPHADTQALSLSLGEYMVLLSMHAWMGKGGEGLLGFWKKWVRAPEHSPGCLGLYEAAIVWQLQVLLPEPRSACLVFEGAVKTL